ncbi:putative copine, protein BONZAI [Helianthus annuus]|nr:putative copine, protein BONZAI [Helianthus annuus]
MLILYKSLSEGVLGDDGPVSHCFNLSGNARSSEVKGVEGLMAAYENAVHTVSLQGPTVFGQVINHTAKIAAQLIPPTTLCC